MRRIEIAPRSGWERIVEKQGLVWHTANGMPYWNESAYYQFSSAEVDRLEAATAELYRICMTAAQHVIDKNLFPRFGIPDYAVELIRRAWDEEPPALNHGRFDLAYDGANPPKMLEYNCDTPTSMLGDAVIQWEWKGAVFSGSRPPDQFNSLHDKLLAKWKDT